MSLHMDLRNFGLGLEKGRLINHIRDRAHSDHFRTASLPKIATHPEASNRGTPLAIFLPATRASSRTRGQRQLGALMSAALTAVFPMTAAPRTAAEFAAVVLAEACKLRRAGTGYYALSAMAIALGRLHAALIAFASADRDAVLACADIIEGATGVATPSVRGHLAPILRAVADGLASPAVAAEFVAAYAVAQAREDLSQHLREIGADGLGELAGAVEALAGAIIAQRKTH